MSDLSQAPFAYLRRFFDEKVIDRDERFDITTTDGTWHSIPYGVVIDAILNCAPLEALRIQQALRVIDFRNGDVKHYLRHLGKGLAEQRVGA